MEQLGSHWPYCHEILYLKSFGKSVQKAQASLKSQKITGTLHEDVCTFMITPRFFFRMRNISDKFAEKSKNTFYVEQIYSENRFVYEIMWKNMVDPSRPLITIRPMGFACRIPKATNTHSEYVMSLIFRGNKGYA
jgi:hypothetical protein